MLNHILVLTILRQHRVFKIHYEPSHIFIKTMYTVVVVFLVFFFFFMDIKIHWYLLFCLFMCMIIAKTLVPTVYKYYLYTRLVPNNTR